MPWKGYCKISRQSSLRLVLWRGSAVFYPDVSLSALQKRPPRSGHPSPGPGY